MPVAIPAAIVGSAAIGAVASSKASKKASKAATNAAATNNALQADIYNQNKATLAPFVSAGAPATTAINNLLGLGTPGAQDAAFKNYLDSTGYQFQLGEGQKAVQAALGARGYLDSGAAQKSLARFGQNQALTGFNTYLGALQGQQGVGLTAASAQAGVGQGYANAVGQNNAAAANAVGNAALSNANTINSALGNGVSAYALNAGLKSSYGGGGAYGIPGSDGIY